MVKDVDEQEYKRKKVEPEQKAGSNSDGRKEVNVDNQAKKKLDRVLAPKPSQSAKSEVSSQESGSNKKETSKKSDSESDEDKKQSEHNPSKVEQEHADKDSSAVA